MRVFTLSAIVLALGILGCSDDKDSSTDIERQVGPTTDTTGDRANPDNQGDAGNTVHRTIGPDETRPACDDNMEGKVIYLQLDNTVQKCIGGIWSDHQLR